MAEGPPCSRGQGNTPTMDWRDDEQYMRMRLALRAAPGGELAAAAPTMSKRALKKLAKAQATAGAAGGAAEGQPRKTKEQKRAEAEARTAANKAKAKEKKKKGSEGKGGDDEGAAVVPLDQTPLGEKKDLASQPFPEAYHPRYVEAAWQAWWERSGFYTADAQECIARQAGRSEEELRDSKFVMVIPPPNVTGSLHLGHALTAAIEDALTRWHRMRGDITLYVPGIDHAGIATQSVVERKLMKDEGLSRHDLGRTDFIERVWQWKEQYGNRIQGQIRHMASSVDWTRECFTMDEKLSRAVTEAFVRFHDDGIIYRDNRLVNWSCFLKSAISEIEVDYTDIPGRTFMAVPGHTLREKYEFGTLTSFAYRVVDPQTPNEEIVVATTRLETMLGDTAVAVHSQDPRYTHLHGKMLQHPFLDRQIPIITDDELVDMEFGTGAVKVTPAHDPNDYACGKRNGLEFITIFTQDGKINDQGGPFVNQMRYDARIEVEKELDRLGLFRGKEPNPMRLGICSRSGDVIEPYMTPQWYVNCSDMAARAVAAVRGGDLKIYPTFHENTWYRWLENIRDWCISRQLWWGHRIPAYFVFLEGESSETMDKNDAANTDRWVIGRTEEEARQRAAEKFSCAPGSLRLEQDEDVLDTWFSSGLFPFSVFGWPDNTEDMQAFYPTSLLETGLDILFFWVARMVMMALQLTDKLPFHTVYLHAMVRDKYGRKMSKALGNVIDPLEVVHGCTLEQLHERLYAGNLPAKEIEKAKKGQQLDFPDGIPECGADALRFGLLAYTIQGRDINLDIKRVVAYRHFCNKLWNVTRFALQKLGGFAPSNDMMDRLLGADRSPRDRFILSRLNATIHACNEHFRCYEFGPLVTDMHSFWLNDLCDVYLELIKPVVVADESADAAASERKWQAQATLWTCLDVGLRLLHPVMPFVTEELWQRLPGRGMLEGEAESIMIAPYPQRSEAWADADAEAAMEIVKGAIRHGRALRANYRLVNSVKPVAHLHCDDDATCAMLERQADDIICLTRLGELHIQRVAAVADDAAPSGCITDVVNQCTVLHVQLRGLIDMDAEVARLQKQAGKLEPSINRLQQRMAKSDYETKVPEHIREDDRAKLEKMQTELATVQAAKRSLEQMRSS